MSPFDAFLILEPVQPKVAIAVSSTGLLIGSAVARVLWGALEKERKQNQENLVEFLKAVHKGHDSDRDVAESIKDLTSEIRRRGM